MGGVWAPGGAKPPSGISVHPSVRTSTCGAKARITEIPEGGFAPPDPLGGKEIPEGGFAPQTLPRHHFKKFALRANFLK